VRDVQNFGYTLQTLPGGRSMRKPWLIPFLLLLALSLGGGLMTPSTPTVQGGPIDTGDVAWMLTATGLVLLMTPGLSFFYGGMVRSNNVISTMLQSFVAMGVISVLWVAVGFSLAFGDSIGGVIGNPMTYFMFNGVNGMTHPALSPTIPLVLFALFQLKFAIITPALITGAFAGGTVVHVAAGCAALAGAIVLGRRRVHVEGVPHEPANIPFVMLGTGMLWFGWFGFNAGSALAASSQAAMAFATTNTASASAALAWMFFDGLRGRKPSAVGACIGAVVGLVAITPAAGYVTVGASLCIGTLAAIASNCVVYWKSRSTLDDTLDVFPCHGVGGAVGMIATGVFARESGLIAGRTDIFVLQVLGLVFATIFTFSGSWLLYKLTDLIIPMRVSGEHEAVGLDISQHGEAMADSYSMPEMKIA
jgi:Amt family ammonium transporter